MGEITDGEQPDSGSTPANSRKTGADYEGGVPGCGRGGVWRKPTISLSQGKSRQRDSEHIQSPTQYYRVWDNSPLKASQQRRGSYSDCCTDIGIRIEEASLLG